MLHNISWLQFITFIGGGLAVYYTVLLVRVTMRRMKDSTRSNGTPPTLKVKRKWFAEEEKEESENESAVPSQTSAPDMSAVHELTNEIQAYLSAAPNEEEKTTIIYSLNQIVRKYPSVKGSLFVEGINNLMVATAQDEAAIELTDGDLDAIWQ